MGARTLRPLRTTSPTDAPTTARHTQLRFRLHAEVDPDQWGIQKVFCPRAKESMKAPPQPPSLATSTTPSHRGRTEAPHPTTTSPHHSCTNTPRHSHNAPLRPRPRSSSTSVHWGTPRPHHRADASTHHCLATANSPLSNRDRGHRRLQIIGEQMAHSDHTKTQPPATATPSSSTTTPTNTHSQPQHGT